MGFWQWLLGHMASTDWTPQSHRQTSQHSRGGQRWGWHLAEEGGSVSVGQASPSFPNEQRLVLRQSVLVRLPLESPLWLFLLWCLWLWLPQVTSAQPASLPRGSSRRSGRSPGVSIASGVRVCPLPPASTVMGAGPPLHTERPGHLGARPAECPCLSSVPAQPQALDS